MIEISVLIPVYNSSENLEELCFQITSALKSFEHEILLVNDCSTDHSWQVIQKIAKINDDVVGLNLRKNFGQDNAIMAGISFIRGKYTIIMDDDLQHSPHDITKLYEICVSKDVDVCYAKFEKKKQANWKNLGSWLNGKIAEWFLKKPQNIYLSPFKIIKSEVMSEIRKYSGPYPYIDGLILSVTNNIDQISVEHHPRYKGKSNFNFRRSVSVFLKHVTTFSIIPLRIATYIGFVSALLGSFLVLYYLFVYLSGNNKVEGWTSLVVLILIIGGLILTSLGIVGEYLGRAYLNINNQPQFTIKEVITSDTLHQKSDEK